MVTNTYKSATAITTSNSVTQSYRGILVQGTGNLKVKMADGADITFTSVPANTLLPISVKKVYATGTTATNLIGLR